MDQVKRVARAICTALGDDWKREGVDGLAETYNDAARAAIAAMKKPSEEWHRISGNQAYGPSGSVIDDDDI